jgi:DNA polymerase-3 subunit alpha
VISREPLDELVPLQRITGAAEAKSRKNGSAEDTPLRAMTQFDMDAISAVGLPKMDVLGLRTLGVLRETLRLVHKSRGQELDLASIPLNDRATFELLGRGETNGLFQLESAGMKQVLRDLRPDRFDDIVAVVALYRPGPMAQIPNYVAGKHGHRAITYLHPALEPILAETYGIIIYQEQVMEIARQLAGLPMGKADALLNAMRKKKRELMASLEEEFLRGAKTKGVAEKVARQVFQQMSDFAGYGFNKAHSACYAISAYQTAYLKANFPAEYMAAQMSSVVDNKEKLAGLIQECQRMGVEVPTPDVNKSDDGFTVEQGRIRFGLSAIKHLGSNAISAILSVREAGGDFKSFEDFCRRLPAGSINRTGMEVLAKSGALNGLGMTRAGLMTALESGMSPGKASVVPESQESLFGEMPEPAGASMTANGLAGAYVPEYPLSELLAMEKELLGLYLSDHPLNSVKEALGQFTTSTIAGLAESGGNGEPIVGGIIAGLRQHKDRSGRSMAFATLEDFTGTVELTIFADAYERCRQALKPEAIVLVKGRAELGAREEEKEPTARIVASEVVLLTDIKGRERIRRRNSNSASSRPTNRPRPSSQESASPPAPRSSREAATLHIRLPVSAGNQGESLRASLDEIKQLIRQHSGPTAVLLHLDSGTGQRILKLGPDFNVQPNENLVRELEGLVGKSGAWLETR